MHILTRILSIALGSFLVTVTLHLPLKAHTQGTSLLQQRDSTEALPIGFTATMEPLLSASQVGPITRAMPFEVAAVRSLFPKEYEVIEETAYAEGEPYQRMLVRLEDETLITFDRYVDAVNVTSPRVFNTLGPRVGTVFSAIYPTIGSVEELDCFLGEETDTGYVHCTAPNADNVRYYFMGPIWDGGYEMPNIETLREWRLAHIRVNLPVIP